MGERMLVLIFALMFVGNSFCQDATGNGVITEESAGEKFIYHTVSMGETAVLIAKQYKITPRDIYDYNKDATNGLSRNMRLRIPLHRQLDFKPEVTEKTVIVKHQPKKESPAAESNLFHDTVEVKEVDEEQATIATTQKVAVPVVAKGVAQTITAPGEIVHHVASGETLFGIARRYNTTVQAITDSNQAKLKHGLQAGQAIIVMAGANSVAEGYLTHEVAYGETLYSLSQKYNVSIDEIKAENSSVARHGLQAGQVLNIPSVKTDGNYTEPETIAEVKESKSKRGSLPGTIAHKVEAGDTLIGLAKKYNTTVDDITASNRQDLDNGLHTGEIITIKSHSSN